MNKSSQINDIISCSFIQKMCKQLFFNHKSLNVLDITTIGYIETFDMEILTSQS